MKRHLGRDGRLSTVTLCGLPFSETMFRDPDQEMCETCRRIAERSGRWFGEKFVDGKWVMNARKSR